MAAITGTQIFQETVMHSARIPFRVLLFTLCLGLCTLASPITAQTVPEFAVGPYHRESPWDNLDNNWDCTTSPCPPRTRPDYVQQIASSGTANDGWPFTRARITWFKLQIDALKNQNPPQWLSDAELSSMASALDGLKIDIEVGGAKTQGGERCKAEPVGEEELTMEDHQAALEAYVAQLADQDAGSLCRWANAGGSIDRLTADHSIAKIFALNRDRACDFSWTFIADQLASYFDQVLDHLETDCGEAVDASAIELGIVESLGYYEFDLIAPSPHHFSTTLKWCQNIDSNCSGVEDEGCSESCLAPSIFGFPVDFEDLITTLKTSFQSRGLTLHHYGADFGEAGPRADYSTTQPNSPYTIERTSDVGRDYGRLIAAKETCDLEGVEYHLIVNAFHEKKKNPNTEAWLDVAGCTVTERPTPLSESGGNACADPRDRAACLDAYLSDPSCMGAECCDNVFINGQSAIARSTTYYRDYTSFASADQIQLYFWHTFPHNVGPESLTPSFFGMTKKILGEAYGNDRVGSYDPATGDFALRTSELPFQATDAFQLSFAANSYPVSGNWDADVDPSDDGVSTVGLYNAATGTFCLSNSNSSGSCDETFPFGAPNWLPISGDFDATPGTRSWTVGVFNPAADKMKFFLNPNSSHIAQTAFRFDPGCTPGTDCPTTQCPWQAIAGVWQENDPQSGVGLYNPQTSEFHLTSTLSECTDPSCMTSFFFDTGSSPVAACYVAIAGDWDGDGVDTIGLYDPGNGKYYLRNSNSESSPGVSGIVNRIVKFGHGTTPHAVVGTWNGLRELP